MQVDHQARLTSAQQNPVYQLLYNVAPLNDADYERVLAHDEWSAVGFYARHAGLIQFMERKFGVDAGLIQKILDYDTYAWPVSIRKRNMVGTVSSLRQRVLQRLTVMQKSRIAIGRVLQYCKTARESYLDAGAALGLDMVTAAQFGFQKVVGIELLPHFEKFASGLKEYVEGSLGATYDYIVGDVGQVVLSRGRFSLVTCIDVLEHTPDLAATLCTLAGAIDAGGAGYIYQGNGRSLAMAAREPHYGLPLISILPKELTIRILTHLGKVSEKVPYCLEDWPRLDEIRAIAEDLGCTLEVIGPDENIRNGAAYPRREAALGFAEKLEDLAGDLCSKLPEELRLEIAVAKELFLTEMRENLARMDETEFRENYCYDSWNLVMRPKPGELAKSMN